MKKLRDMMAAYLLHRCKHLCMLKFRVVHGRRKGGAEGFGPPWILKLLAKKLVFLNFEG